MMIIILKLLKYVYSFFLLLYIFTINTLFFIKDTMHRKYEDQGKFNFLYQIPPILYSSIISSANNIIVTFLSLSQNDFLDLKKEKKKYKSKSN